MNQPPSPSSSYDGHSSSSSWSSLALAMALGLDHEALAVLEKRLGQADGVQQTAGLSAQSSPMVQYAAALEQEVERLGLLDHIAPDRKGLHELPLALVDDPRALMIKLVEHLDALQRAVCAFGSADGHLARRALYLYGPMAGRLGIYQLKWRIEDLGFRLHDPHAYHALAKALREHRASREQRIQRVQLLLHQALNQAGLSFQISGRSKHLYSIYNKMQRKGKAAEALLDLSALRILVDDVDDCYRVLAIVHALLPPLPDAFKDYIVTPKSNGYRSLHTVVLVAEDQGDGVYPVEIQVRTHQMHREAELGVAAHWLYKENRLSPQQQRINALRTLLDQATTQQALGAPQMPAEPMPRAEVFCLTPHGDVIRLPSGATVVDFAYAIHTEIGHRCRGALVNGVIVPLHHRPQTGDRVEILTKQRIAPNREWMRPGNPFVRSKHALAKVRSYFRRLDEEQRRNRGQNILSRILRRLRVEALSSEQLESLGCASTSELVLALGEQRLSQEFVVERLHPRRPSPSPAGPLAPPAGRRLGVVASTLQGPVNLEGQQAGCCQPHHGQAIIGYLASKGGIMVHRQDCRAIEQLAQRRPERLLHLSWPN